MTIMFSFITLWGTEILFWCLAWKYFPSPTRMSPIIQSHYPQPRSIFRKDYLTFLTFINKCWNMWIVNAGQDLENKGNKSKTALLYSTDQIYFKTALTAAMSFFKHFFLLFWFSKLVWISDMCNLPMLCI